MFAELDHVISKFILKEKDFLIDYPVYDIELIFVELPKFKKEENDLQTHFDKWLFVLNHLQNLQDRPKALQERVFEKLFKTAEIAMFTVQERQEYEDSLKYFRDMHNIIDTAKEEAKEEKAIDIAKEMIIDKEPIDKIIKYTKLEKSFIEALIKEIESSK